MPAHSPSSGGVRPTRRRWVPPQHGAWAMLLVPFAAGVVTVGAAWVDLPLFVLWISGYLCSYYALLVVKLRRVGRVGPQLAVYGGVAAAAGLVVLATQPRLVVWAPAFAALVGVNAWYAWRKDDRALANDLAAVVQACLMVPVVAMAANQPLASVRLAFLACLLYFAGTVLYVKTMIREKGRAGYLWASWVFHGGSVVAVAVLSVPVAMVFVWFLVRAVALPGRALSVRRVGLIEVADSVVLLAVLALQA